MKLSKFTDYAVVLLACLGQKPRPQSAVDSRGFRMLSTGQLADETSLPKPTVQKLLKRLCRASLVRSLRGTLGGYALDRSATCISVADVIIAVEGPIALTACVEDSGPCEVQNLCAVRGNWDKVNQAVYAALSQVSLVDMTPWFGEPAASMPAQRSGLQSAASLSSLKKPTSSAANPHSIKAVAL